MPKVSPSNWETSGGFATARPGRAATRIGVSGRNGDGILQAGPTRIICSRPWEQYRQSGERDDNGTDDGSKRYPIRSLPNHTFIFTITYFFDYRHEFPSSFQKIGTFVAILRKKSF
jgi:hypothetical protein